MHFGTGITKNAVMFCVCVCVCRSERRHLQPPAKKGEGAGEWGGGRGDVADVKLSRRSFYICVIVVLEDL